MGFEVQVITPVGPGHEEIAIEAITSCLSLGYDVIPIDDTQGKLGRSKARNIGVKQATAEWLFFLDADDLMHKDAVKAKKYTEYDAIWGLINDGKVRIPQVRQVDFRTLVRHEPTQTLQIGHFVKRDVAIEYPFNETLDCGEDFDYFLRLWRDKRCIKIPHTLFVNRRGNHSTGPRSATGKQWSESVAMMQERWKHPEETQKIQTKANLEIKNDLKKKNIITKENYFSLARNYPTYGLIQVDCFNGENFTMRNNNDDSVVSSIVWLDGFENTSIAIWSVLSRNAQVILDVGSYTGLYSLVASANNASADITAFEPLSDNYIRLTENIKLNKFKIRMLNIALSDSTGTAGFNIFSEPGFLTSGGSLLKGNNIKRSEEVELSTIDTLISEGVFNSPELIKIDVEGAELSVLKGMQTVFEQGHRPDFLIEVLDDKTGLTDFFDGMGYRFYQVLESDKKIIRKNSLTGSGDLNALNNLVTSKTINELTALLIDIEIT